MRSHNKLKALLGVVALVTALGMVGACSSSGGGAKTDHSADSSSPPASHDASSSTKNAKIELPADIAARGSMTVGISTLYPPYVYLDNNQLSGYEYDLLNAISKELGVKFNYERAEFSALIPGVQSKRYDMAASGISDFADREKVVDFVDYTGSYTAILARKSADLHVSGWLDLCGLTVGVAQGTAGQRAAEAQNAKCAPSGRQAMKMSIFKDAGSLLVALEAGRVDAMPRGLATAVYDASKLPDKLQFVDTKDTLLPLGAAFLKGNDQLVKAVAAAVQNLNEDGTLLAIHKKWNLAAAYLSTPGINLGK